MKAPRVVFAAEHLDLGTEVGVGHVGQQRRVGVGVRGNRRERLIEVPRLGGLLGGRPGGRVERSGLGGLHERGTHHAQVLQQLDRAALLRRRAVVELRAVDLAREVKQDADFVLQRGNEFGLGQDHGFLEVKKGGQDTTRT